MPVKILKFLTMFAIGGTERQFVYVTKGLDRSRFDVRVGCLSREGDFLKEIESLNVPVSEYPISSLYSPRTLRGQWRFARDLRTEGVRLVHAYGYYPNVFCVPAARLAGCATIAAVRDTGIFTDKVRLKNLSQKMVCQMADRVVANSRAVRDWLISLGVDDRRILIIPNGIVVPPLRPAQDDFPIRRELGISPTAPVVAVVSRLNPGKGVEYFLRALVLVSKRFPAARYLIVGCSYFDANYKTSLQKLAEDLNLSDRVIFTGERRDIPELLQEVDLSVLPSLSEGFSNSLLEAMAAQLAVVTTDVGGNPEIVIHGKTGLLVPPRDFEALGYAINRMLEYPDIAREFGRAGYERVASNFSLESTVRRTEDLYMSVLDERSWRGARPIAA